MNPPLRRRVHAPGHRRLLRAVACLAAIGLLGACTRSSNEAASLPRARPSAAPAPTPAPAPAPEVAAFLLAARPFTVHTPPGYDPARPAPLLVLLHGFGVTGALQEQYLGLTDATDAHGMLFVAPDGTPSANGSRFWNATDACCGAGSGVDDVAYLSALVADVKAHYSVDPRRVFLVGHSNGGFMSYRMACERADEIAAVVSIAGATFVDSRKCRPSAPVAVAEVHGTGDRTIKYHGGRLDGWPARYPSAPHTVQAWARADGCRVDDPETSHPSRRLVEHLPAPTVQTYTGCRGSSTAQLWTLPRAPHIPSFTPLLRDRVVEFLLAHPKR
jgi:polyhydroxybutyrate depolymerase